MLKCKGFAFIISMMTCDPVGAPPDTFCQIYKPVYWHASDTRETKVQTDLNNRKWKRLCAGGHKK